MKSIHAIDISRRTFDWEGWFKTFWQETRKKGLQEASYWEEYISNGRDAQMWSPKVARAGTTS